MSSRASPASCRPPRHIARRSLRPPRVLWPAAHRPAQRGIGGDTPASVSSAARQSVLGRIARRVTPAACVGEQSDAIMVAPGAETRAVAAACRRNRHWRRSSRHRAWPSASPRNWSRRQGRSATRLADVPPGQLRFPATICGTSAARNASRCRRGGAVARGSRGEIRFQHQAAADASMTIMVSARRRRSHEHCLEWQSQAPGSAVAGSRQPLSAGGFGHALRCSKA